MNSIIEAARAVVANWDTVPGNDLCKAVHNLATLLADPDLFATEEEIGRADDEYSDERVAIDSCALASRSDEGVWVQAWVWLQNPDNEEA